MVYAASMFHCCIGQRILNLRYDYGALVHTFNGTILALLYSVTYN